MRQELHLPNPMPKAGGIEHKEELLVCTVHLVSRAEPGKKFHSKIGIRSGVELRVSSAMSDWISDTSVASWNVVRENSPLLRFLASHPATRLCTHSPLLYSLLHKS